MFNSDTRYSSNYITRVIQLDAQPFFNSYIYYNKCTCKSLMLPHKKGVNI